MAEIIGIIIDQIKNHDFMDFSSRKYFLRGLLSHRKSGLHFSELPIFPTAWDSEHLAEEERLREMLYCTEMDADRDKANIVADKSSYDMSSWLFIEYGKI